MKNVSPLAWPLGGLGVDTENVQEIGLWYAVLVGKFIDTGASLEGGQHCFEPHSPIRKNRRTKAPLRIDDHVSRSVLGEVDDAGPLVVVEIDPREVGINDLVEHSLVVSDNDELTGTSGFGRVACMLGVVVEHLGTVRVQLARREHVLDTQLVSQAVEGWPDTLKRHAGTPDRREYIALG